MVLWLLWTLDRKTQECQEPGKVENEGVSVKGLEESEGKVYVIVVLGCCTVVWNAD